MMCSCVWLCISLMIDAYSSGQKSLKLLTCSPCTFDMRETRSDNVIYGTAEGPVWMHQVSLAFQLNLEVELGKKVFA